MEYMVSLTLNELRGYMGRNMIAMSGTYSSEVYMKHSEELKMVLVELDWKEWGFEDSNGFEKESEMASVKNLSDFEQEQCG